MGSFFWNARRAPKKAVRRGLCRPWCPARSTALLIVKNKGRALPLRFIGGLDIEMVVDRNCRTIRPGKKLSDNDRIAWSGDLFRRSAALPNVSNGVIRKLFDVAAVFRRRADAGDFNPFLKFGFEFVLHAVIVPQSFAMTWRERTEAYFKGLQDRICGDSGRSRRNTLSRRPVVTRRRRRRPNPRSGNWWRV